MMYDTIVVGAGIEGSAAAYHLAKRGRKTLLLEQFPLPHSRGSSHGHSRITRMAYPQPFYSSMMVESFRIWEQLEREAGTQLYIKTGLLSVDKTGSEELRDIARSLESAGVEYETLSAQSLRSRYPSLSFDDSFSAVLDPTAGILRADRCLTAFQRQFEQYGGLIHDGEPVLRLVVDSADRVTVTTSRAIYHARTVVLAAGPWTSQLTEPLGLRLPLEVQRVSVCFWERQRPDAYGSLDAGHPVFIIYHCRGQHVYGLPALEYPKHIKVGWHCGVRCDPDSRDELGNDQVGINIAGDVVRSHLPGVKATPVIVERCLYTVTPDGHFFIDTHPTWKNVVIAAGFSGHGFKLAAVVGKIIGDLITTGRSSYDLSHFAISRFSAEKLASKL